MKMKYCKWELMLHNKIRYASSSAFEIIPLFIASVHEKIFKVPVSPGNDRLAKKSGDTQSSFS